MLAPGPRGSEAQRGAAGARECAGEGFKERQLALSSKSPGALTANHGWLWRQSPSLLTEMLDSRLSQKRQLSDQTGSG
jgi:hypothetical protein